MKLAIKALSPLLGKEIPLPSYATGGSAAMDLRACVTEPVVIAPGARTVVPSGIAIALPSAEYVALVFARSGLAAKGGVCLANGVGVIDSDYRGEIGVALLFARSGLAAKGGVCLANGVGVIDSDYRGEVGVALLNTGIEPYTILPGDRIAQLMVVPVVRPALDVMDELPETERGAGGFGSTGR